MKKFIWLIPLLFGLNTFSHDATNAGDNPGRLQVHPPLQVQRSCSDSELEKAVRAQLENDAQLKQANLNVNAYAERNEVTLSGTVRSRAAREKAIELAKRAKPGVAVNDKIDIKPGA